MSFSQDPAVVLKDALQKNYARVRFQQGKPVLDRELNLLADLANSNRVAEQYLGNGMPVGSTGFRISNLNVAANDFTIDPGRCLVGGFEVVLPAATTYKGQPNKQNVAPLPAGASNVYLRAFLRPVTEIQDPALNNTGAGNVGFATSSRESVDFEVIVTAAVVNSTDQLLLAVINTTANSITDRRRLDMTAAAIRDEVTVSRGSASTLGQRLDASLAANGALKAGSVANAQLAVDSVTTDRMLNGSVTTAKLAAGAVGAAQLAALAVSEPNLADNSVSRRTIASAAISISKMSPAPVFDGPVVLPPSPGPGLVSETVIDLELVDTHAFYLISVHFDTPRPAALPLPAAASNFINWTHRVSVVKVAGVAGVTHRHQVLFQNPNNFAITVSCRAFRIAEV